MPLQPRDSAAFAQMLWTVAAVYGREVTSDVAATYFQALKPYDLAAVRQALDRHVKSPDAGQYMPKPADIIRMLGGTSADAAMGAWAKVEKAIRRVGGHESVVFDDPLVHRCVDDLGGWPKLCATPEDELPFRARDFQALYRGFAMRREVPAFPARLVGRFEAQNRQAGQRVAPPMLIGDPQACRDVLKLGGEGSTLQITQAGAAVAALLTE